MSSDHYLTQLQDQRDRLQEQLAAAEAERDGAYRERAHLVAWLAALHPAVIAPAPDIDEPGWQIIYLQISPHRQASWHISPRDADLFKRVEHVPADDPRAQWDGHTTRQKYNRIRHHTTVINLLSGAHPVDPVTRAGVAEARIAAIRALAADMRQVLEYEGPRHAHLAAGVWDTSGLPCGHCARVQRLRAGLATLDGPSERLACCVCGSASATYFNHLGLAFCPLCADCHCSQTPCERTGVNDPAVSSVVAAAEPCTGRPGFCRSCRTIHLNTPS
ncbi:hypothetical protein ABH930_000293 [Kitasatospora sp. GAS204A]|uniref:hypothetical protein n=1 Tax=unclassified Kitasatospora TaxID=2633591 RepID=UPI002473ABEF|nr:hypothetical protein [Kitasatospora sp. GAS204B]MDH6116874.1 hypothetical protein [Kitasatospora sp. GAS204B]